MKILTWILLVFLVVACNDDDNKGKGNEDKKSLAQYKPPVRRAGFEDIYRQGSGSTVLVSEKGSDFYGVYSLPKGVYSSSDSLVSLKKEVEKSKGTNKQEEADKKLKEEADKPEEKYRGYFLKIGGSENSGGYIKVPKGGEIEVSGIWKIYDKPNEEEKDRENEGLDIYVGGKHRKTILRKELKLTKFGGVEGFPFHEKGIAINKDETFYIKENRESKKSMLITNINIYFKPNPEAQDQTKTQDQTASAASGQIPAPDKAQQVEP